ncbi:Piso0_003967 [Millerozyma farinosa CBS 7064]|uniref:NAD-dependent protein deacetylase n=1 Tax=Pichia sorbitophila (strain ATCC MYA-4447 / BCRC 22081 / CBS 7064 / NBRC 10061 / NRRL Y-12695) TaxID=559304 RepID=G8Y743_PICSO|nr:Piso0_003967 [Millerozyma farinosa CBS 7064]CCE84423.1 Piso0_003967 [Millerozyma farinosa CBS 7064]
MTQNRILMSLLSLIMNIPNYIEVILLEVPTNSDFNMKKDIQEKLKPLCDAVIKQNKRITFFQGAGISTSAGIPDFRSPKTGLYSNLSKLNLPYPEAVFDIDYFKENPKAFYTLAEELFPGNFMPTKYHYLLKLLQDKGKLHRVYTQNIDTLERIAGVKDEYIVEAHGSFASSHCIDCNHEMSTDKLRELMKDKTTNDGIPICPKCKGYVKSDIVFFGEGLPEKFFSQWEEDADDVSVAIVAGTSLTVYPFASLPSEVSDKCIRLLLNKEVVGDFQYKDRKSDIFFLTDCDEGAEHIADAFGWREELENLIASERTKFTKTDEEKTDAAENAKNVATLVEEAERDTLSKSPSLSKKEDNDATDKQKDAEESSAKLEDAISKLKI